MKRGRQIKRKLPKVNRTLANSLEDEEADNLKEDVDGVDAKKTSKKKKGLTSDIMKDERFKSIFEIGDFEIDENSHEYRALHPMPSLKQPSLVEEHFEPVMGGEEPSDSDASEDEQVNENNSRKKSKVPRRHEVKDERHADAFRNHVSLTKEDALPLGERVAALSNDRASRDMNNIRVGPGGSREVSFVSISSAKYVEDEGERETRTEKRRGI
ncbi:uncharacterized protein LOC132608238 [Lycium barbarum]|uniref:uncharacterized protein LOC132608238 n=1 Tax=Lycium barbarum TaxID=112863 RepID=UPI00293E919B|nr:uncharacterized protein LOC132608238 [Lycium barbarum]